MSTAAKPGERLSRARVVQAAIDLADREGIEALTVRALADALGTKPMSLYHYVDGKDAVLGEMVEEVFRQISAPEDALPWKQAVRGRCLSAREVLSRHQWAVPLMESRSEPGPETLQHHEAMLATFARGGLPLPLMAHAYAVLDAFVYGFAMQEANLSVQGGEGSAELAAEISADFDPDQFPHLVRLTAEHVMQPGYAFGDSFEYGLDILLDGIEAAIPGS